MERFMSIILWMQLMHWSANLRTVRFISQCIGSICVNVSPVYHDTIVFYLQFCFYKFEKNVLCLKYPVSRFAMILIVSKSDWHPLLAKFYSVFSFVSWTVLEYKKKSTTTKCATDLKFECVCENFNNGQYTGTCPKNGFWRQFDFDFCFLFCRLKKNKKVVPKLGFLAIIWFPPKKSFLWPLDFYSKIFFFFYSTKIVLSSFSFFLVDYYDFI